MYIYLNEWLMSIGILSFDDDMLIIRYKLE